MSSTIDTNLIYNQLNEKFNFKETNPLDFFKRAEKDDLELKTFRTLPVEIRAIVPDRVHAFLEFNSQNEFVLYYRDFDTKDTMPADLQECIWYAVFFYLLRNHHAHITDTITPFINTQPKSMFPFKPLAHMISDDNTTHNSIVMNEWGNYEKVCFHLYRIFRNKHF